MVPQMGSRDQTLLAAIAEFQVATVRQLAVLVDRNEASLRRRLRELGRQGLVRADAQVPAGGRGRPEDLITLTEQGARCLAEDRDLAPPVREDQTNLNLTRCLEHLLLVNELRAQLALMERAIPAVHVSFLSPTSPFLERTPAGLPLVHEKFPDENGNWVEYTPDGVFALSHEQVPQALLFFVEVDMGTETLASPRRPKQDVRQKILNYQTTYRLQRHERVGRLLGREFRGFRLLFLANDLARSGALCRLVKEMPPSSFIYVTDRGSIESKGVWSDIWVEGGRLDLPRRSILGSQMPNPSPAPSDLA